MNYVKPYDVALVVGRFQPIHIGHENNIRTAMALADRTLVLVGSAQEHGTERNPFDVETRIRLIREVFGDEVLVYPLPDLTNEKDVGAHWGAYLLDQTRYHVGKIPDLMIYGDEDAAGWFGPEDLRFVRMVMPRARIPFSATMGRELMLRGDEAEWQKWHNPHTHKHFNELRGRLLRCQYYSDKFESMLKPKELKPWTDKGI